MLNQQISNKQEIISRNTFLRKMGFGSAAMMALLCTGELTSCTNEAVGPAAGSVDFTIDLTATANNALTKNGGYIIQNNIVIAKTSLGTYAAVTLICSHEQQKQVMYRTDRFYCTAHGAEFDNAGKGLNTDGKKGLTAYKTELTGTTLRVYA